MTTTAIAYYHAVFALIVAIALTAVIALAAVVVLTTAFGTLTPAVVTTPMAAAAGVLVIALAIGARLAMMAMIVGCIAVKRPLIAVIAHTAAAALQRAFSTDLVDNTTNCSAVEVHLVTVVHVI